MVRVAARPNLFYDKERLIVITIGFALHLFIYLFIKLGMSF
jgi:hypothetical protein